MLRCFWVARPRAARPAGEWQPAAAPRPRPVRRAATGSAGTAAAMRPRVAPLLTLVCVAAGVPALIPPAEFVPAAAPVAAPAAAPAPPFVPPFLLGPPLTLGPAAFAGPGGGDGVPVGGGDGPTEPPGGDGPPPTEVPEPNAFALFGLGLLGVALLAGRRRTAATAG